MEDSDREGVVADGLVSVREAERFLSIKKSKLYQLMDRGDLPYVKLGAARRIPRRALVSWAARHLIIHQDGT
ncbi:MAG TPA: helix-turn-helix domain-containing protein [Firmicutes bacterium]|nr:helix-turn-helix domain-containing protein [Bacillota bacterium]